MALSGSFYNYPVSNFGLYCEWSGSQSVSGNYTDVTLNVYLKYWSLSVGSRSDSTISINGDTETYTVPAINHYPNANYTRLLKTKTVRVYHNSDGTKSCSLSASWRFSGTYSGVSIGTITASATVTLDTIARSSTIASASNITLGNPCSVTWTPTSSSFTYRLKFSLGSWNHTTGIISPARTSSYTYAGYTIPITVANEIPSATTGTMTVYLYSYNGSTQIGSTVSKAFTVTVPTTVKPKISSVTATIDNSSNSVINEWGVAVAGYTRVKVVASAEGSYGSTISGYTISGGYNTTQNSSSLSYTGSAISLSGDKIFTVVAKDSRGRSSDQQSSSVITFYPYSKPTISVFTASRSTTTQNKVIVKANWTFSSVNEKNESTATLYYKKSNATNWTEYGIISRNESTTLDMDFEVENSYNFRIVVSDSLGSSVQEEAFVSTIDVLMNFRAGGKGLGIGKVAESDNLEIKLNTIFIGDVYIRDENTDVPLATYIKQIINGS